MQVKERLKINAVFSVIGAFIIAIILILTLSGVNRAREERELVGDLLISSFERITFRSDYLRTGNERARLQWFAESEQVSRLLKTAADRFNDPEDKKTVQEMSRDHDAAVTLFSGIVRNREREQSGAVSAKLSHEIENRLVTQLNTRLYDKVLHINRLRQSAGAHLRSSLILAGWSIFFVIAVVTTTAAINSRTISRTIINRVRLLQDGASIIGQGNLDHRIDLKGDDEFIQLSGAFNAMTAKLQASYQELRESEERYRALISASSHVLYRMSPDWTEMWQLQGGSFIADTEKPNRNWLNEYIHPDDQKMVLEAIAESVRTGSVFEMEHRVRRADGTLGWTFSRAVPLRNAAGEIVEWFGAANNITDRREAEENIKRLNKELQSNVYELESSNKELEAFVYSVAHDLRAPLRSISGFSQILLKSAAQRDPKEKKAFNLIIRNAQQMNKIIDDLLYLSRISRHEIHKENLDIGKILKAAAARLQADQPRPNVSVEIKEGMLAFADARLIQVALSNLLGNAWKFTSRTANPKIECGASEQQGKTVYYVKDNGAGFDQRFTERMFLPFHRLHTEQEFEGTGIGLAIVERVIRRHGGKIWAEGKKNEGATFFFTLS
jgi:signal transduction histidine kinase/HAMP domain-containing protein